MHELFFPYGTRIGLWLETLGQLFGKMRRSNVYLSKYIYHRADHEGWWRPRQHVGPDFPATFQWLRTAAWSSHYQQIIIQYQFRRANEWFLKASMFKNKVKCRNSFKSSSAIDWKWELNSSSCKVCPLITKTLRNQWMKLE